MPTGLPLLPAGLTKRFMLLVFVAFLFLLGTALAKPEPPYKCPDYLWCQNLNMKKVRHACPKDNGVLYADMTQPFSTCPHSPYMYAHTCQGQQVRYYSGEDGCFECGTGANCGACCKGFWKEGKIKV